MTDQIDTLRKLQEIDAQLFRLRTEQRQRPLEVEHAKQLVAEQQANAHAIEARLKALQVEQKHKELELSTRDAGIKKLQLQLFQVKTNKEYTAIQHEIDQSKADVSLSEEEILKLLETIDQTTREYKAQLVAVAQQEATWREEEVRTTHALTEIQEQVTAFDQQRQTIVPLVKADALSVYERVLASREGLAMVPLVNDSCDGCHMVQPPQVVNEVRLKAKLVTCESCNRILYLDNFSDDH